MSKSFIGQKNAITPADAAASVGPWGVEQPLPLTNPNVKPVAVGDLPEKVDLTPPEPAKLEEKPAEKPAAEPTAAEPSPLKLCPYCGWDQAQEAEQVSEEDKLDYRRAIMGRQPWRKTLSLFGDDGMRATFRTRYKSVDDQIQQQLVREVYDGRLPVIDSAIAEGAYVARRRELQLAASLERFEPTMVAALPPVTAEHYPPVVQDGKVVDAPVAVAYRTLFADIDGSVYAALTAAHNEFERLVIRIVAGSRRSDFLKAAKPA
jgi:hypothetical protein